MTHIDSCVKRPGARIWLPLVGENRMTIGADGVGLQGGEFDAGRMALGAERAIFLVVKDGA